MKKLLLLLSLASIPLVASPIVFPVPPFPTPSILQETFDTTATGAYLSNPTFGGIGVYGRIGPINACMVATANLVPPLSPPHSMFGRGCDVQWKVNVPMRRFGGWFRSTPSGPLSTTATFNFFDAANNPIGTITVPLTPVWTWRGFLTIPKWSRVEVIGNASLPGYVAHDNVRVRWF
jgi:hypothetical protein